MKYVFAYHEIVRSPDQPSADFDAGRCDVVYQGTLSPDFYSWIFPHGQTTSVGTGTMRKGFSMRGAVAALRQSSGLGNAETIRREGAPIPLKPLRKWDNGRDLVLAGDAAGVVAPASGEGIYYAMAGGRFAADAVDRFLATGDARALASARRGFMRLHGPVFWILGIMQRYWYSNDGRRERFVSICRDRDVQELTFDAYMNKALVKAKPRSRIVTYILQEPGTPDRCCFGLRAPARLAGSLPPFSALPPRRFVLFPVCRYRLLPFCVPLPSLEEVFT